MRSFSVIGQVVTKIVQLLHNWHPFILHVARAFGVIHMHRLLSTCWQEGWSYATKITACKSIKVVAEIWASETRDHGRPAAHTQKFPLIYERLRSLRSLGNKSFAAVDHPPQFLDDFGRLSRHWPRNRRVGGSVCPSNFWTEVAFPPTSLWTKLNHLLSA